MFNKIDLPYSLDALEPYYDRETLDIHYNVLYNNYVNNANKSLNDLKLARVNNDYSNIKYLEKELSFQGSGAILHSLFFENISPIKKNAINISEKLMTRINNDFGSYDNFLTSFKEACNKVEASGWGILAYSKEIKQLVILQCEKHQDLTLWGCIPILVIDMWEHSYFLKYKSNREEYLDNIFKLINYEVLNRRFDNIYFSL